MKDRFWVEEIIAEGEAAQRFAEVEGDLGHHALLKAMENMFEASTALSESARDAIFPENEWTKLRKARNFYVHQYNKVHPEVAQATARKDVPVIVERAKEWLRGKGAE